MVSSGQPKDLSPELYYLQLSELRPDAIWVLHPVMPLLLWILLYKSVSYLEPGNHQELNQCVELVPTPYLPRLNPETRCLLARLTGR